MRTFLRFLACWMALLYASYGRLTAQEALQVSANGRFLTTTSGQPFFWLGDTAWELLHRLKREEMITYLRQRQAQGFNLIQTVVLAELDGLRQPNPYGHLPLLNEDPRTPNPAYFEPVDYFLTQAAAHGFYVGLLPTWGDKVFKESWGQGPEVFNPENARAFGTWLGQRYGRQSNVVWILGGDRNPRDSSDVAIWRALAEGLQKGAGENQPLLMTFHPQPNDLTDGGSSKWFHQDPWLDFNMFQTGHCRENPVWDRITVAYEKKPTKPVLDGETIYEDHPVCFNASDLGTSSAYDVRKHAYLAVFAGACGHTYGCHGVWQMYAPGRTPINGPHFFWYDALNLPGANQMQYLRRLMEARPLLDRVPAQDLLLTTGAEHDRRQATRGRDYIFVYSAQGRPISLRMGKITGAQVVAHWYDPRTGQHTAAGTHPNRGNKTFYPPRAGYGQDWVLVLDDATKGYTLP